MTIVTFTPPDNEFAAASGDNVNYDPNYSYFDYPPNSTKYLVLTSNPGDPDPYTFETGETYDLTWQGNGGGSIEDATVIRSDDWGNGQGVIVFEGINSSTGKLVQIVYTPNFDLEKWYWSNGGGPSSPNGFYTADQMEDSYSAPVCFAPGTMIEGPGGARPVEFLRAGDLVRTLDRGFRPVRWVHVTRQDLRAAGLGQFPVRIAAGALGPARPTAELVVSAQHRVLVGGQNQLTDSVPQEVFVPAKSLTNRPGITHLHGLAEMPWVHFALDRHEVIVANGSYSESLSLGKMAVASLPLLTRMRLWSVFGMHEDDAAPLNGPLARPAFGASKARRLLRGRGASGAATIPAELEAVARQLS